ncbi:MAG: hypothetical protein ACRDRX_14825 [Pseudonocardiaceae bacterium]
MSTSRTSVRGTRSRVAAVLATLIRIVGGLIVFILVAHIVLTVADANPANGITTLVASWADRLHLGFRGLFTLANAKAQAAVDYGLPALVWLIVTWVLTRLVRRLGG